MVRVSALTLFVALTAFSALSLAASSAAPAAPVKPCGSSSLKASFLLVPGSRGAGNAVYRLHVSNVGPRDCWLDTSRVTMQLAGLKGQRLPTRAQLPHSDRIIAIAPKAALSATARFSPSVNGTGDRQFSPCQPLAAQLRLRFGFGAAVSVVAAIKPATPVCERGYLAFSRWSVINHG